MAIFRRRLFQQLFVIFMGVSFLNMSFFMAEISALKPAFSKGAFENIAKLLSISMTEEEQDVSETSETQSAKVLDLVSEHLCHLQFEGLGISLKLRELGPNHSPRSGHQTIITPPPDRC